MRWTLDESEVECHAIRSQGAGGQNVNKVATAIHLRFDVKASSLPDNVKARILASTDSRLTTDGIVVIKAQAHRTQARNREEAIGRLQEFISKACRVRPPRMATRPTLASKIRRVEKKTRQGKIKSLRGKPRGDE